MVFAAWSDISVLHVDTYIAQIAAARNKNADELADFRNTLLGIITKNAPDQKFEWAARRSYIAFGTALAAAAAQYVDVTPMEGFNAAAFDELLGLKQKGLRSVTLLPLGYRDEQKDWLAGLPKV